MEDQCMKISYNFLYKTIKNPDVKQVKKRKKEWWIVYCFVSKTNYIYRFNGRLMYENLIQKETLKKKKIIFPYFKVLHDSSHES